MAGGTEEQRGLAAEILAYFVEHPKAVDDLEGVSGWRLLASRVRSTVENTQQGLESLVALGYLQKIETKSGALFQMNPERLEEAERFLHEAKKLADGDPRKAATGENDRGNQN